MKIANVVSVHDRGPLGASSINGRPVARIDRMADLLRRYPAIEDAERRELVAFLVGGPQEEIVQVTYFHGLEPRLRAFRQDHARAFGAGVRGWLPMILFVVIAALGVGWRLLA